LWLGSLHGGALKLLHAVGLGGARPPNAFWYIFRLSGCRFWQTFLCNLSLIFIYWGRRNFAGVSNIMSVLSRECMASLVCVCVCVCTLQPAAYSLVCKGRRESRDSTAQFSSPSPGGGRHNAVLDVVLAFRRRHPPMYSLVLYSKFRPPDQQATRT